MAQAIDCKRCYYLDAMTRDEVHKRLREDIVRTDNDAKVATDLFNAVMHDIPFGVPHLNGTERIRNASIEYAAASSRLAFAMKRHHTFMIDGIVPEDLKR